MRTAGNSNYPAIPRRIRRRTVAAILLMVGGGACLFAFQERQSALNRQLIEALRRAHYSEARTLLNRGADANTRPESPSPDRWQVVSELWRQIRGKPSLRERSDPPLLLCRPRLERSRKAAVLPPQEEQDRERTLEALIRHGAEVDALTMSGLTLLQTAALQDDKTLLRVLLDHDAKLNPRHGTPPPLNLASGESARMLIERGADVNALFVSQMDSDLARLILPDPSAIVTPLSHAVAQHDEVGVRLLLEHGAAPKVCRKVISGTGGRPGSAVFGVALLFEYCSSSPDLLALFLRAYGDINKRNDETGMSLLEEEITMPDDEWKMIQKEEAIPILLKLGARPTVPDARGGTALTEAAKRAHPLDNSPDAQVFVARYRALLKTLRQAH